MLWSRLPSKSHPNFKDLIHDSNILFDLSYLPWFFKAVKKGAVPIRYGLISFTQSENFAEIPCIRAEAVVDTVEGAPWKIFSQNPHFLTLLYNQVPHLTTVAVNVIPGGNLTFQKHSLFPEPPAKFVLQESEDESLERVFRVKPRQLSRIVLETSTWGSKKTEQIRIGPSWSAFLIGGYLVGIQDSGSFYMLEENCLPDRANMIRDYNVLKRAHPNAVFLTTGSLAELVNIRFSGVFGSD